MALPKAITGLFAKKGLGTKLGGTFEQIFLWQVLGQLAGAILAPPNSQLQQEAFQLDPNNPLSPAEAVDAVVRNHLTHDKAANEARNSGINDDRFKTLVAIAGQPPGLEAALSWYRRGIIPFDGKGSDAISVEQIIAESDTKDKYTAAIKASALLPISVADAVDAVVENQIPYAQGEAVAYQNGISKDSFRILVNTRGNPPSPSELIELVRRRIIPEKGTGPSVLSLEQGISEGATKDKWIPAYEALLKAVPPPRTVVALLRNGSIDDARAQELLQEAGLSPQDAAAYVADAHHQKTATHRDLARDDVLALYYDRAISADVATQMLEGLGYNAQDSGFLLGIQDFRRAKSLLTTAIGKIRSLYVGHKIDAVEVTNALGQWHVPDAQQKELLAVWQVERDANVVRLTAAEYCDAVKYGIIDVPTCLDALVKLGFTPQDAVIRLGVTLHAPVGPVPAAGG